MSTILTLDGMDLDAVLQQINLNLFRKLYTFTRSQNPLYIYSTPSKFSAILCIPLGNPLQAMFSRFFLLELNCPSYMQGLPGCLLGSWPSGPKPCGGNKGIYFPHSMLTCCYHSTLKSFNHMQQVFQICS